MSCFEQYFQGGARRMRVILHARPGSSRILAGDGIQAAATAAALRAAGIQAELDETGDLPGLSSCDLVHLFNLIPVETTHRAYLTAAAAGVPMVLSPVYWDPAEFLSFWDPGGGCAAWWRRTENLRREVLAGAGLILPNGAAELACLERTYGPLPPHRLVPNGVDADLYHPPPRAVAREPHVLCVGRISARKNQLGLIEALRGTGLRLKLIGPVNDYAYYRACRAAAWPGVSFLPEVSGRRLADAYAAAPVHALVSWYETPGLASLEAAACGCRVVSTDRGTAREYLGEQAFYCPPGDRAAIRNAVLAALAAPERPGLSREVRARFTWAQAARATLAAYEEALNMA